jgi:uncharacterized membrane protein
VYTSIVDTFNGRPLHPLVVHAAVVLTPLAALVALALVRPSWRERLRWPAVAAVAVAWGLVWLSRASGTDLQTVNSEFFKANKAARESLDLHIGFADKLNYVLFALLVVLVVFAWLQPKLARPAGNVGAVVIAVLALMVIGLVAQTGEQGARTLWNPDGKRDYSVGQ